MRTERTKGKGHNSMKLSTRILLSCLMGLFLASCGGKAQFEGIVMDTAGNPIADAAATVEGTRAMGMSDSAGKFSMAWTPGTYNIVVGKSGYLSYAKEMVADEAGTFDLGTIELQPTPPGKGLWLFDNNTFTELARVGIVKESKGLSRSYCVPDGAGEPTLVPAGEVEFFDWSQLDRHLIRLTDKNCAGQSAGPPKYETVVDDAVKDEVKTLADDQKLRTVTLTPGSYVYADWTNGWFRTQASYFLVK